MLTKLSRKVRLACLLCLLVCTVGCDQTSKYIARAGLSQRGSIRLPGGVVELTLAENPGSFLGLGRLLPEDVRFGIFTIGIAVGLLALVAYLITHRQIDSMRFIGLALIMAGGIGNLVDRVLRHGLVTDFAVVHVGPLHTGVFNLADVLIMIGATTILWTFRGRASSER